MALDNNRSRRIWPFDFRQTAVIVLMVLATIIGLFWQE
jgi:hypothetical protein